LNGLSKQTLRKQQMFGFKYIINGQERTTIYSRENCARLTEAFNDENVLQVKLFHQVQHGLNTGTIATHVVKFAEREVVKMETGISYRLVVSYYHAG